MNRAKAFVVAITVAVLLASQPTFAAMMVLPDRRAWCYDSYVVEFEPGKTVRVYKPVAWYEWLFYGCWMYY
jgi:hypothetical protein